MVKTMDKRTINVEELAEILGISYSAALKYVHQDGFPAFRIGHKIYTTRPLLSQWIEQEAKKGIKNWRKK